jgi:DNA-binding MarR family transcriptional regulator
MRPEPVDSPCVCATLRMATRSVSQVYDAALAPSGLRTTQFSILARLDDEGPAAVGRLAGRLAMDRTTLTREARPLLDRGLVSQSRGSDRRTRVLALTPAGTDLVAEARPGWQAAQRRVAELFGRDRTDALRGELHGLVAATWTRS